MKGGDEGGLRVFIAGMISLGKCEVFLFVGLRGWGLRFCSVFIFQLPDSNSLGLFFAPSQGKRGKSQVRLDIFHYDMIWGIGVGRVKKIGSCQEMREGMSLKGLEGGGGVTVVCVTSSVGGEEREGSPRSNEAVFEGQRS